MGLKDGLPDLEVHSTTVSGTTAQFGDAELGAGAIGNAEIADDACSGTKVSNEYSPIKTGSPSVGGLSILTGNVNTGAGSNATVTFGTAFAAAPTMFVTPTADTTGWMRVAGTVTASGVVESESASVSGAWIAIGSGRV